MRALQTTLSNTSLAKCQSGSEQVPKQDSPLDGPGCSHLPDMSLQLSGGEYPKAWAASSRLVWLRVPGCQSLGSCRVIWVNLSQGFALPALVSALNTFGPTGLESLPTARTGSTERATDPCGITGCRQSRDPGPGIL